MAGAGIPAKKAAKDSWDKEHLELQILSSFQHYFLSFTYAVCSRDILMQLFPHFPSLDSNDSLVLMKPLQRDSSLSHKHKLECYLGPIKPRLLRSTSWLLVAPYHPHPTGFPYSPTWKPPWFLSALERLVTTYSSPTYLPLPTAEFDPPSISALLPLHLSPSGFCSLLPERPFAISSIPPGMYGRSAWGQPNPAATEIKGKTPKLPIQTKPLCTDLPSISLWNPLHQRGAANICGLGQRPVGKADRLKKRKQLQVCNSIFPPLLPFTTYFHPPLCISHQCDAPGFSLNCTWTVSVSRFTWSPA